MFSTAKARAKAKGIPFTITLDHLKLPANCPALGIPLDFSPGQASDFSPSLERVVPGWGYVPGNVVIISNRANRIKNDASIAELQAITEFFIRWAEENWSDE